MFVQLSLDREVEERVRKEIENWVWEIVMDYMRVDTNEMRWKMTYEAINEVLALKHRQYLLMKW